MTISQIQLEQALSEPQIKRFWLGYFQEGLRESIHQAILELYENLRAKTGITRSELAHKIGRRPEQVTRWLSSPTNLEIDTISDMALAMGMVPKVTFNGVSSLFDAGKPNQGNTISDNVHRMNFTMKPVKAANGYEPYKSSATSQSTI